MAAETPILSMTYGHGLGQSVQGRKFGPCYRERWCAFGLGCLDAPPLPSRCHPSRAFCDSFSGVAATATKKDVARIEQRAAVLQLFDVVAIDAPAFTAMWCCALRVFAAAATLFDDCSDQRSPFRRVIDRISGLRPRCQSLACHLDAGSECC